MDSGAIKELVCKWKKEWERRKGIFFRGKKKEGKEAKEEKSKENFNDRRRNGEKEEEWRGGSRKLGRKGGKKGERERRREKE